MPLTQWSPHQRPMPLRAHRMLYIIIAHINRLAASGDIRALCMALNMPLYHAPASAPRRVASQDKNKASSSRCCGDKVPTMTRRGRLPVHLLCSLLHACVRYSASAGESFVAAYFVEYSVIHRASREQAAQYRAQGRFHFAGCRRYLGQLCPMMAMINWLFKKNTLTCSVTGR